MNDFDTEGDGWMDVSNGRNKGRKNEKGREQHHRQFQVHNTTDEKCHTPYFPLYKCVCKLVEKGKQEQED